MNVDIDFKFNCGDMVSHVCKNFSKGIVLARWYGEDSRGGTMIMYDVSAPESLSAMSTRNRMYEQELMLYVGKE